MARARLAVRKRCSLSNVRLHEDDDVDHERGQHHGGGGPRRDGGQPRVERHEPGAGRRGREALRHVQRLCPHRHGARDAHHKHDGDRDAEVAERAASLPDIT